jgi:(p)ppGpp synthase/HD superfamily hydrolase
MTWNADAYLSALNFASKAHLGQTVPGTEEPYLRHVTTVAAEVMAAISQRTDVLDPDLAVQCALLHDVIEDTEVTDAELRAAFGDAVADGVAALTKDGSLGSKEEKMKDSLQRIRKQPYEVWMVKLADRITNLQPPPAHWDEAKIDRYREEAKQIAIHLNASCKVLSNRLNAKIEAY